MTREEKLELVPVWEKAMLTLEEAAAYTGVGIHKLREISYAPDNGVVLWVGNKRMYKKEKLVEFLENAWSI